jgi:hypothetical protein
MLKFVQQSGMLRNLCRADIHRLSLCALCMLSGSWFALTACGTSGNSDGTRASGGAGNSAGMPPGSGGALAGNAGTLSTTVGGTSGGSVANGGSSNGGSAGIANGAASGSSAAGSGGSSAGAPGAGCNASGLLFCDDFEKLAPGPVQNAGPWTTAYIGPDAPTITVDASTPAHSGTHSVRVHAPVTDFQSFLIYHDTAVLPRAQGDFYLRSYVRLGREMSAEHNAYMVFDRFAAPGAGAAVRLGEQSQMLSLTVGGDAHGSLSNSKFSQDGVLGPHFTANSWACLEGYFNSVQPEIDFWLDGVEISDFHHSDWPVDSYDTLHFGFEKYAGPELDIWFDDIAISATRIGCQ